MNDRQAKSAAKKERNAQIVARIKAGEKRYVLALEFGLLKQTVGDIARRAGIPAYTRFERQKCESS